MINWRDKIERARWWAIQNQPFYAALAMRLLDEEAPAGLASAATDGRHILWSPEFVASLTDAELRFCLLHETLHCAHQHFWRLPATYNGNIAGDHAINLILLDLAASGADIAMPEGGLADPAYKGMSEEDILAQLPTGPEHYSDACGGIDPNALAQADTEKLAVAWTQAVLQAEMAAKAARSGIPSDMDRLARAVTVRRIDWRHELAEFVRSATATHNDWTRSARRHSTAPCICPRKKNDGFGAIVFVRDTSGSIDDAMLGVVNAAIEAIVADCGCGAIILDCDDAVRAEYRLAPGDSVPDTARGGGCTDFRPAFAHAESLDEPIAGIVYLTDLAGEFPETSEFPTLWAVTGAANSVPFGRIVRIVK